MKTLLLFVAFLLIASTIEAKQPFAPKAKAERHHRVKKYKPGKNYFSCVRHKKVNRKGITK